LFSSHTRVGEQEEMDVLESLPGGASFEPEKMVFDQEQNQRIIAMLGKLPIEQRLIVELKVFQAKTFQEIADVQDVSENTVKTRFYTALKKLKVASEENHVLS